MGAPARTGLAGGVASDQPWGWDKSVAIVTVVMVVLVFVGVGVAAGLQGSEEAVGLVIRPGGEE